MGQSSQLMITAVIHLHAILGVHFLSPQCAQCLNISGTVPFVITHEALEV
jgi:hypothetical protein